jgi:hypothetical protein
LKNIYKKTWLIILIVLCVILFSALIAIILINRPMPVALLTEYDAHMLWQEGVVMNDCAECHNASDFHTCETCHDDHGAVELAGVRFFEVVELTGDVPDPSFVRVNEILPDQENLGTHITLFDFLEQNGVQDFESVTFTTNDGGLTTIESQYLDETAMLVPYLDGIRFVTDSVHSSTWLKGINRIIVVGMERPLKIDGEITSIGRLLIGNTVRLTVEGSDVMLEDDIGRISHAFVANWAEGALLQPLLKRPEPNGVLITDAQGNTVELSDEEIENAVIAIVRDEITLILPERGRSAWPTQIVEIESN